MYFKRTALLLYILLFVNVAISTLQAQVHTKRFGQPQNLASLGLLGNTPTTPTLSLNAIQSASLLADDELNVGKGVPFRFGLNRHADIEVINAAVKTVQDDFTVYVYRIDAKEALSLNLIFDRFRLKEGAKMFLYNSDRTMLIGPITASQNPDSGEFWTDIVQGSSLIIEVQEPLIGSGTSELHISSIIHGYHSVFPKQTKAFGNAGSCHPNMICYPAYQTQGDGVAMILSQSGTRLCSGSMINNMRQSFRSYFLTANHCIGGGVENWLFRFNYQSTTCTPGVDDLDVVTLNGATLRANNSISDFALLELTQQVPPEVNTTYNGWNRSAATTSNNFGIHHPRGDVKKISFTNADTQVTGFGGSSGTTYLTSFWGSLGTTDYGSSGSPLFDGNKRIVGQLYGGPSSCGATGNNLRDYYGRFHTSWTGGGADNNRISNWLDPDNSTVEVTDWVKPVVNGPTFLISSGSFGLNTLNSSVVTWSVADSNGLVTPTTGTGNVANLTVLGNGSAAKITFTVNDGQSYPIKFTKTFDTVLPATAKNNSAICEGGTVNLMGAGNGTFSWTGPSGFTSTSQNPSIGNIPSTASGIYTLTVTNAAAGYTSSATTLVTVIPTSNTISTNLSSGSVTLQATQTIIAANKIIDPARAIYKAGKSITLNQGFIAQSGSTFETEIAGCENVAIPGLVAYYPFNGNANDETGNGFNGTINGATLTTDKFGAAQKALNFDGNDFVRIPNLYNATSQPLENVTYSLWFRPNQNYGAADFYSLIIRTTDGGFTDMVGKPDLGSVENNKFQFYMFDNVANVGRISKATTINFTANQWVHVVATRANGTMKIYLNATKEGEATYTNPSVFYPDLYLGGHATFNRWYFNGALDDLRIYNRDLSDAEVQAIYNAEKL